MAFIENFVHIVFLKDLYSDIFKDWKLYQKEMSNNHIFLSINHFWHDLQVDKSVLCKLARYRDPLNQSDDRLDSLFKNSVMEDFRLRDNQ